MPPRPFLGITVMPEYYQYESIEQVLDNLEQAGATAVTTSPYVMELADEKTGHREPPLDGGAGSVRVLDRPLWGQHELFMRTAPSFVPNSLSYQGLRYQPSKATDLTLREGPIVERFIKAAQGRGLKVYFQIQAAIPPGYRVQFGGPVNDDLPRLPSGKIPQNRVANNGSLASPHILDYQAALISDLCQQYPSIDGIRFDWPEYPPYELDSVFVDFCHHAEAAAERMGIDFASIQRDVAGAYHHLHHNLTSSELVHLLGEDPTNRALDLRSFLNQFPGLLGWVDFKARLVEELLQSFRQAMDEAGGNQMELIAHAFPPPWSHVTGLDFQRASKHCQGICVKLYGMHWAMMLNNYGTQILRENSEITETDLVHTLVHVLDLSNAANYQHLADYRYPPPNQPHPIDAAAQIRKIEAARSQTQDCPLYVLAHSYGPVADVVERIRLALENGADGIWVNRYCYLSDEKLAGIKELLHGVEGK